MVKESEVTIIIPHLGQHPYSEYSLDQCVQSLVETTKAKIVIAKNGPPCAHFPKDDEPQGQCWAVNRAVAESSTPWVFVTNDDMIYAPNWFEALIWEGGTRNTMFDDPYRYCISPQLVEPRVGAPTFRVYPVGGAGGDFNKDAWLKYADANMGYGPTRKGFNLPFLIERELWNTIGGYDENYDPWGSNGDSDLQYKIMLAGIKPTQNPNSLVYHFSQTSGTFHPDNRSYWDKNWHYFIDKWGFERASAPEIWTCDFEIPMDKLKYKPDWMGKYAY